MPTYVYACTECDHRFEAQQAFSDPSLTECPNCGGKLRKVFNSVGIVFKGSGFYRNDSRGAGPKESPAGSGAAADAGKDAAKPKEAAASSSSSGDSSKSSTPAASSSSSSSTSTSSSSGASSGSAA